MKHHIPITPRNEKPSTEWPHVEIPGKTAYCFLIILLLLYKFYKQDHADITRWCQKHDDKA